MMRALALLLFVVMTAPVLAQDKVKRLLSSDHFSVDGTLLEAWASPKSFRPKDGSGAPPGPGRNGERDFHGERRKNDTHVHLVARISWAERLGLGRVEDHFPFGERDFAGR